MGLKLIDIFLSRCQKIPNIPSCTFALCTTQGYKRNLAEIKRYSEKSHEKTGGEMNLVLFFSSLSLSMAKKRKKRDTYQKSKQWPSSRRYIITRCNNLQYGSNRYICISCKQNVTRTC
mmetsp:Transcript_33873/g.45233  ORF Transcript_33873/g.45233 Transcript_33873/m.45233 type:complete len:118 (-) Transcript_33873:839-1192(-)